jgi:CRP-like cAMP-binding protein
MAAALYTDPWRTFIKNAFSKIPCFSDLTDILADEICYSMKIQRFSVGEHVQRPGDSCDQIMIVTEGRVKITFELADRTIMTKIGEHQWLTGYGIELRELMFPDSTSPLKGNMHLSLKSVASIKSDTEHAQNAAFEMPICELGLGSVLCGTATLLRNTVTYTVTAME